MYAIRSYYELLSRLDLSAEGLQEAKILAGKGDSDGAFSLVVKHFSVITSYSIHYTKLYELEKYKRDGVDCPVDGGFNKEGQISRVRAAL